MKLLLLTSLLFSACNKPAELDVTTLESQDTNTEYLIESPTELGVIEEDDCEQEALGSKVCNVVLYDQNDDVWQLYDHHGKIIILDFSTAWCYPCQVAGQKTQPIQDDYIGDVVFVTFLIEGRTGAAATLTDVQSWVTEHNITTAPVLQASREYVLDPAGITGYLVGGFPTYVYLDRNLTIVDAHVGFNEQHVRQTLDGLL